MKIKRNDKSWFCGYLIKNPLYDKVFNSISQSISNRIRHHIVIAAMNHVRMRILLPTLDTFLWKY